MRHLVVVLVLLMAVSGRGQSAPAVDPMSAVAWLAGDWTAEAQEPGSTKPPTKIVSHYRSVLGGKGMTIETSFDGVETYRGMFGYDGAKKAVAFWYVTTGGESVTGTVAPGAGYTLLDFTITKADGTGQHLQTHMTRVDGDQYRWELFADPKGTGWVKLFGLEYARVK